MWNYKEFTVKSTRVNEGLMDKDITEAVFSKNSSNIVDKTILPVIFDAQIRAPYPLNVKKAIDVSSKQDMKKDASTGTSRIEPGSVQLVIKQNQKTPLLKYNKKVMLELTGGDYTSERRGLDLVTVVDVSSSMHGKKMNQLKTALQFVLQKLSPIDRLSMVTYSNSATKLCPLRQITEASRRELQQLIDGLKARGDGTNIEDGLLTGLSVLDDRRVSDGRIAGIMLMSDGHQGPGDGDATQVMVRNNVPVHTFGFGTSSDPNVLSSVATNSMGGTFSHVLQLGGGGLTMAFSQCLAGLLTVAVQHLELTVEAVGDESSIVKVSAGSYPQTRGGSSNINGTGGSVTVKFGDLYSREVRKVIVDLHLPAIGRERSADILKVTYSYRSCSSSAGLQFVAPPETLTVWRTDMKDEEEMDAPAELHAEEARLRTARMITEAKNLDLRDAQRKLVEAQNWLDEQSNPLLKTELHKLLEHIKAGHGNPYALSTGSSHDRQRFAARGSNMETLRLFATPRVDKYLEQANKFHKDPTMPLPSVDDDIKAEAVLLGAFSTNVANMEEEIRRLSLDAEVLLSS